MRMRNRSVVALATGVAATAALALGGAAHAGPVTPPLVELDIAVSDGSASVFNPAGSDAGGGIFQYQGTFGNSNYDIDWDFAARPDATAGAFVGTGFTVMNLSDQTLDFSIVVTLPLDPTAMPETMFAGSGGFTLTGTDALLSTFGGQSAWTALIDGASVGTLFDDPFELSFDGQGSDSASANLTPGMNGPADTIGVALSFSLSPGDIATTTGTFGVIAVPAPGALALLAVGGLAGTARRRRA